MADATIQDSSPFFPNQKWGTSKPAWHLRELFFFSSHPNLPHLGHKEKHIFFLTLLHVEPILNYR